MEILYQDRDILVCIKPAGVKSTDEPGGLPELVRQALGEPQANLRTVHRLDQVVSGLMVLARSARMASELSRQIRENEFRKEYLAVVHGQTEPGETLEDWLCRDRAERKTYVAAQPGKDARLAVLDYETLERTEAMSLVQVHLHTGRTHQIRCQFSSRGWPLVGDRKYSILDDGCPIALWSYRLAFRHPWSGAAMEFCQKPPEIPPWADFGGLWNTF